MKAIIEHHNQHYQVDFSKSIDLSIPLTNSDQNPIAWYLDKPTIEPVTMGDWIGKVSMGSSTNFNNIVFNPHAHGTHTECLGHITNKEYSINQLLREFNFMAELHSLTPIIQDEDLVITRSMVEEKFSNTHQVKALIIRTLPNPRDKKSKNYSHTNPPYFTKEAMEYIVSKGIEHILVDLPSVDREVDGGRLEAHKAFWNVSDITKIDDYCRTQATITEMIYVEDAIKDGLYFLNLQIASFENDASPSKPVIYELAKL